PPPGSSASSPLPQDIELEAQKLIHETGSVDAAKIAVELAAERENAPDFQEDHFAQRWGFTSRAQLRGSSKPVADSDGNTWWATELPSNRWVVWNKDDMSAEQMFDSLEEARQSLDGRAAT